MDDRELPALLDRACAEPHDVEPGRRPAPAHPSVPLDAMDPGGEDAVRDHGDLAAQEVDDAHPAARGAREPEADRGPTRSRVRPDRAEPVRDRGQGLDVDRTIDPA